MDARAVDIGIMGGGPAGAFAALVLSRAGRSVALVDADTSRKRIEGLSPRVVALFARHGLDPAALGIGPRVSRRAFWNGAAESGNGEHLVERAAFDRALRAAAVAAGVTLVRDNVVRIGTGDAGHPVLELKSGRRLTVGRAIDARGRRAPVAAERVRGPATLTVGGWLASRAGAPTTTTVPCPDGWLWLADFGDGRAWLQASLDGEAEAGGKDLSARVAALLAGDDARAAFGEVLAVPETLLARNADTVMAAPELDPAHIRIGDAAVGLDPLSGHGMFWATSSALATVPILAALDEGTAASLDLARRFYRDRIAGTFWRQARVGRDFYRLESRFADRPFWAARQRFPDDEASHGAAPGAGEAARIDRAVIVEDNRLVERPIVRTAEHPTGVAFVAGVPIVPVLERLSALAPSPLDAESLHRTCFPGTSRDQAAALIAWLDRQGLIASIEDPTHERRA